jgi:hypothetical protein
VRRFTIKVVASACSVLVFLLFAFPNYCDRCSYRDVENLLEAAASAASPRAAILPPCCDPAGSAAAAAAGERDAPPAGKKVAHDRVPYCIGNTLSTVTTHSDLLEEIRRTVAPEAFRAQETAFARLSVVLDHKESRAPPA